ncbi:MAG: hypothetical protein AAGK21_00140 [Bacteroidota bacterium]
MSDPDAPVAQALRCAAALVLDQGAHPFEPDETSDSALAPALDAGRLSLQGDGVAFTDAQDLEALVVRETADRTSAAWPDLDAAHAVLGRFERLVHRLDLPDTAWPALFEALETDHGLSPFEILRVAAETPAGDRAHRAVWTLYPPLADALAQLDPDPEHLAATLSPVIDAVSGDGMNRLMHNGVRRLASTSPERAHALASAFAANPGRSAVQLTANALLGLAEHDPEAAHRRALDLSRDPAPGRRYAGVAALGWLGDAGDPVRLGATVERLRGLIAQPVVPEDLPVLAHALGALADTPDPAPPHLEARRTLVEVARDQFDAVCGVVARVASRVAGSTPDADWLHELLDVLSRTPTTFAGVLQNLDHALVQILKADPSWVVGYLRSLVLHRPPSESEGTDRFPDLVSMTMSSLLRDHLPALEAEVTRWLASGDPRLQDAACEVIAHGHVPDGGTTPFRIAPAVLASRSEAELERVVFALLGHTHAGQHLAPLLVSVVWGPWATPRIQGLTASALADSALYDFPGSATRYLTRLAVREDTPPESWPVIAQALARSSEYFRALDDRPRLKELAPPDHRIRRHLALLQDQRRDMQKRAHQESEILSLFTTVPLKHGRAWFSEQDGTFEPPRELQTSTYEVEVCRSLFHDPLGYLMNKHHWRDRAAAPLPTP